MNNDNRMHLIPPSVIDIVDKFSAPNVHVNEKMNYLVRLEAIRDYCISTINKHNNSSQRNSVFKETRNKSNHSRIGRNNV